MILILDTEAEKLQWGSRMRFHGNCWKVILSIAEVVRTGVICTSAEVGTYDIGHDTGTEFKGAELLKKIEENYKFADFFELNFDDVVRKDLVPTDKAFLAWLEKYGEDKWFEWGVKKSVAEIRKQVKEKTRK